MRTQQGTDFVSLLYAKQILIKKQITIDTQFLERAEGSFRTVDREWNIYDMKTTLILNREYRI